MARTGEQRKRDLVAHYERSRRGVAAIQHMLDLDAEFPTLQMFGDQCISAEVGRGWVGLLRPCLEVLAKHGCKVGQIKQKFCGLRLYWDYPDHIEAGLAEWRALPKEFQGYYEGDKFVYVTPLPFAEERARIDEAVRPVIAHAEVASFKVCDDCGGDIPHGSARWGRADCDACAKRAS